MTIVTCSCNQANEKTIKNSLQLTTDNLVDNLAQLTEKESVEPHFLFKELDFTTNLVSHDSKQMNYEFIADSVELALDIDLQTEVCLLNINDKTAQTEFNYFYDTSLELSIEEIKILKQFGGEDVVVLMPTFTEEFLAFELIKFKMDSDTVQKGFFEINTHEIRDVRNFYLKNSLTLVQEKDSFKIALGDFEYENVFTD
ncbi:MAG: hypothetical protein AB8B72_10600 [Crocinitomicaceae bacterium]